MNKSELGQRLGDLFFGKKVEGIVAAVLPSHVCFAQRYAVRTEIGEIVDAQISDVESFLGFWYVLRDPKKPGEQIKERALEVKPWVDGQIV